MRGPSLEEWRDRARAVLDPAVWSYLEAGADSGLTLAGAAAAWDRAALRPRVLRGVEDADTAASIFGVELALPVLTAPNGRATRYHPDGEAAVMRAAAGAGSIAILPSSVAASAAALAALHPRARWWQQLYLVRDRVRMAERLAELRDAGCGAVVLTADLLPDGRAAPPPPPRAAWEASAGWEGETAYTGGTLDDLAWLCAAAGVPVLVKGVLRADDAALCIEHGARGVIVSNHGGNQLDTAIASADALAAVVDACGASGEVLVDGGIRRGTAVLKALALGARAVLVGRPVSHALAAGGAEGVESMLGRLGAELARAMALCGAARLADLDRSLVAIR